MDSKNYNVAGFTSSPQLMHLRSNLKRVESFPGTVKKPKKIFNDLTKEDVASQFKLLEMLEFPLPKNLWQDTKETKRCSVCNCRFRRYLKGVKHHCRICGKVVCSICSQNR